MSQGKAKKIAQYEIGDYVIEETLGSFRIKRKGQIISELPKTVVPERHLHFMPTGEPLVVGETESRRPFTVQMPPNAPKAVQQAFEKSVVLQSMPDSEQISTLVSLYGLQDHSLGREQY
jgi:hypothetical protein